MVQNRGKKARPRQIVRRRPWGRYLLLVTAVLLGLMVTSRQAHVAELSYGLSELKDEAARLEAEREQARLDIARLASLERIETLAVSQLGMERPEVIRLVFVPTAVQPEVAVASATSIESDHRGVGAVFAQAISRLLPTLGRAEARGWR